MNERIKAIRKALSLTQQEFADKLGVKRNTIAQYETGRNEPIDAVFSLMCRVYNINASWLRTGEGEMFIQEPLEDEYFKAATELSMQDDKLAMQAVIEYWKLDDSSKQLLRNFIRNIVKNSEN